MKLDHLRGRWARFRLTILLLGIALACIWAISVYIGLQVRDDTQRLVSEQQLTAASILADEVDRQLQDRLNVLTTVAGQVSRGLMASPSNLQAFLKDRPSIALPFNGGMFITDIHGTAIADFPVVPGRVGTNYMDRESISVPLKEGKSVIGRPNMGKTLKAPIFSIVVPIHDDKGAVIGAIAGTINLGLPNFLDNLANGRHGKRGTYLVIVPQYRLIVMASDKSRVMETLPPVGDSPARDRLIASDKSTAIFVNARGVEVISSLATVPVSGWQITVSEPTADAFAVVKVMQQRVMIAAIIAALLATLIVITLTTRLWKTQHSAILALYDPLTQLANRRLMEDRLNQSMTFSQRSGNYFAVMVLDLDNFKPLNDKHGHSVGDSLLIDVADRLRGSVRGIDTVVRLGGDEFVVILGELAANKVAAISQATTIAEKICAKLADPYLLKITKHGKVEATIEHRCTASIGITMAMNHTVSQKDLIKNADAAMYQAKAAGRNAFRFYEMTSQI